MRLRYAYILKCERVITDPAGAPIELKCTIDTESLHGATAARRVKGTIHWVSAAHAIDAEVRLYDRLFRSEDPGEDGRDPLTDLNPESLTVLTGCKVESMLAAASAGCEISVRAAGLFLRRSRFHAERAGVQPHRHAQRHLGEDQRQGGASRVQPFRSFRAHALSCRPTAIASGSLDIRSIGQGSRHVQFWSLDRRWLIDPIAPAKHILNWQDEQVGTRGKQHLEQRRSHRQ